METSRATVQAGARVVFIYLTAGDDGRDSIYWATRERGVLQSTRVAAGVAAGDHSADHCSIVSVLDHAIRKCTIANTESYFLRLPDGHRNGIGFSRHSFQSLRKLRQQRIAAMSAVDGSAAYNGWPDLKSTIDSLIGESSAIRIVTVHTSDPSVAFIRTIISITAWPACSCMIHAEKPSGTWSITPDTHLRHALPTEPENK